MELVELPALADSRWACTAGVKLGRDVRALLLHATSWSALEIGNSPGAPRRYVCEEYIKGTAAKSVDARGRYLQRRGCAESIAANSLGEFAHHFRR